MSLGVTIRPYETRDEEAILELNELSVSVLSPMDSKRFSFLRDMTSLLWVAEKQGRAVAFIIGMQDGEEYDSPNYQWFSKRFKNFLYIDRIVVAESERSSGIGQQFYSRIESWAKEQNIHWLLAEVDINPPNVNSLNFHELRQFTEVSRQELSKGKLVSLRTKILI